VEDPTISLLDLSRLMLSAFIKVCLISESCLASLKIGNRALGFYFVNVDLMNNLITGSFG